MSAACIVHVSQVAELEPGKETSTGKPVEITQASQLVTVHSKRQSVTAVAV